MARVPEGFDHKAYCAEMEQRIKEGHHLVKAADGFYYYTVAPVAEAWRDAE